MLPRTPAVREASLLKLRFLAGGAFNSVACVLLSQLGFLLTGRPVLAFVTGYAVSLVLSYVVNAVLVFRAGDLSVTGFVLFCASYVPNFLIQVVAVAWMTGLGVAPWLAYVLGVAIGVPVTFLILSRVTFGAARRRPRDGLREPLA